MEKRIMDVFCGSWGDERNELFQDNAFDTKYTGKG